MLRIPADNTRVNIINDHPLEPLIKMTRCRVRSQNATSVAGTQRYIPSHDFSQWKSSVIDEMDYSIINEEKSYWIEREFFLQSKHNFEFTMAVKVTEISIFVGGELDNPWNVYYVLESEEESFLQRIRKLLTKKGMFLSEDKVWKRKGYFFI